MTPKIKNIIIFVGIATVFVLIYIFFIKSSPKEANLVSSTNTALPNIDGSMPSVNSTNETADITQNFLAVLSNVKNIKLDDAIFFDSAFNGLRDSTINLIKDGPEGRPNPFAPIGVDFVAVIPTNCTLPKVLDALTNTCITPLKPNCISPQVLNALTNTCVSPSPN